MKDAVGGLNLQNILQKCAGWEARILRLGKYRTRNTQHRSMRDVTLSSSYDSPRTPIKPPRDVITSRLCKNANAHPQNKKSPPSLGERGLVCFFVGGDSNRRLRYDDESRPYKSICHILSCALYPLPLPLPFFISLSLPTSEASSSLSVICRLIPTARNRLLTTIAMRRR